jgi:hypothetical protein
VYIFQLAQSDQDKIKAKITRKLRNEGYKGTELIKFVSRAMNSKVSDLD